MERELSSPVDSVSTVLAATYLRGGGGERRCRVRRMWWAALSCLLHAVAMGFAVGYSAPATFSMRRSSLAPSESDISWIGSLLALGAMCGGLVGGPLSDKVGRRSALLLNSLVLTGGWFCIVQAQAVATVAFGRFVCGLGCGVVSVAAPAYCLEIASPEVRGLLGSLFQTAVGLGALLAALLGARLTWHHLALASAAASGLAMLVLAAQPESPQWWLAHGDPGRALRAARCLQGSACGRLPEAPAPQSGRLRAREWLGAAVWKPALITLALMAFQQGSGANAILFYSTQIFDANRDFMDPEIACIVLAAMQVIATLASNLLVDRLGRRALLIFSGTLMGISELGLAIFYYECDEARAGPQLAAAWPWVPLLCVSVAILAFSLGLGPLPWLLAAEMSPLRARASIGGLATFANGLGAFAVTKTFALLLERIHDYGAFMAYGLVATASCVFVVAFLPETKGKELQDIAALFCKDARSQSLREVLTHEISTITMSRNEATPPRACSSIEDPRASTSKEDPRASTSIENPRASTSKEDPRASTSKEDPRADDQAGGGVVNLAFQELRVDASGSNM